MHPTLRKLEKGDKRSIGRSNEVVSEVLAKPTLFHVVFSGLSADDPLIRMRAADAVEKITAHHEVAATGEKELRWHVAQMLPRLDLTAQERRRVFRMLLGYLNDRSSVARTFAMQALVDVARDSPALLPVARQRISKLAVTGSPAMKARGRKLLKELATSR